MKFSEVWQRIGVSIAPGTKVRNWTAAKGYLGDQFVILKVGTDHVEVDPPGAETTHRVRKRDFEYMHSNWADYCAGPVKRKALVKHTRVSKYTMSILKHIDA